MQMAEALKKAGLVSDNDYDQVVKEKTMKMIKEQAERHKDKKDKEEDDTE